MARLPSVGGDSGSWGTVLNEFLAVSLASNGEIKLRTWADSSARPASPVEGQVGLNLETGLLERYSGSAWSEISKSRVITGTSATPPDAANYSEGTIYFVTS